MVVKAVISLLVWVFLAYTISARAHWGGSYTPLRTKQPKSGAPFKPKGMGPGRGPEGAKGRRPGPMLPGVGCWDGLKTCTGRPCRIEDATGAAVDSAPLQVCQDGVDCSWGPRTCSGSDGEYKAYFCNYFQSLIFRHACNVTTPDGAALLASSWPCCSRPANGDPSLSSCDLGPLTLTCDDSMSVQAYFCLPQPPRLDDGWFVGVLGDACQIVEVGDNKEVSSRDCPASSACNIGPLDVTIDSKNYQAFYCDVTRKCPIQTSLPVQDADASFCGGKPKGGPARGPSRGPLSGDRVANKGQGAGDKVGFSGSRVKAASRGSVRKNPYSGAFPGTSPDRDPETQANPNDSPPNPPAEGEADDTGAERANDGQTKSRGSGAMAPSSGQPRGPARGTTKSGTIKP